MKFENFLLAYSFITIMAVLISAVLFSEKESFLFLGSLSNIAIAAVSLRIKIKNKITPFILITVATVILIILIISS
jgi:hypothetical protein